MRQNQDISYWLSDFEKNELKRKQIYYIYNGGILGSMNEVTVNDTIIVGLNIVYEENQYSELQAKELIQPQVEVAAQCYNTIEVKFYVVWTAGEGSFEEGRIVGRKDDFINIFLSKSKSHKSVTRTDAEIDENSKKILTKDIFFSEGQFKNRGFWGSDLSHELAYKFGIATYLFKIPFTEVVLGNAFDDLAIYAALGRMYAGLVIKYIHWGKPSPIIRVSPEFQPTIFDYLRAGAKKLAGKK